MAEIAQRTLKLLLAATQHGISPGPATWIYPSRGMAEHWCLGCGRTIQRREPCARGANGGHICTSCFEAANEVDDATPPPARIHPPPESTQILMDGAADQLESRVTILAIAWDDEISSDDVHRLSRAWAQKISEKRPVNMTRIRIYADHRLTTEADHG